MEQPQAEVQEQQVSASARSTEPARVSPSAAPAAGAVAPQACATCGATHTASGAMAAPPHSPPYVYVIGHIEPIFPLASVEKEARQVIASAGASNDTDRAAMKALLSDPNNMYLVRMMCWVLSVHGVETYILVPRVDADYQQLIDAYRAEPNPGDLDLVIGVRGGIAHPSVCNGLQIPVVTFDRIYFFDRKSLLDAVPKPEGADPQKFTAAAGEMFDRIMQQADSAGATDCDRAQAYLAVKYGQIYALAAQQFASNHSFTSADCRVSSLSGARKVVEVIFSFTDRTTSVLSKFFTRVDVTERLPFLVTPLQQYFDNNR